MTCTVPLKKIFKSRVTLEKNAISFITGKEQRSHLQVFKSCSKSKTANYKLQIIRSRLKVSRVTQDFHKSYGNFEKNCLWH